ncbi:hypothetical protein OKW39_003266 [Paraburkholderia sp. MM6662-R1]
MNDPGVAKGFVMGDATGDVFLTIGNREDCLSRAGMKNPLLSLCLSGFEEFCRYGYHQKYHRACVFAGMSERKLIGEPGILQSGEFDPFQPFGEFLRTSSSHSKAAVPARSKGRGPTWADQWSVPPGRSVAECGEDGISEFEHRRMIFRGQAFECGRTRGDHDRTSKGRQHKNYCGAAGAQRFDVVGAAYGRAS